MPDAISNSANFGHQRTGHGAAEKHGLDAIARTAADFAPQFLHVFSDGPVEHQPQGPFPIVLHQKDDRFDEIRVQKVRRRCQQLTCQ
jgi:hypothetical protein